MKARLCIGFLAALVFFSVTLIAQENTQTNTRQFNSTVTNDTIDSELSNESYTPYIGPPLSLFTPGPSSLFFNNVPKQYSPSPNSGSYKPLELKPDYSWSLEEVEKARKEAEMRNKFRPLDDIFYSPMTQQPRDTRPPFDFSKLHNISPPSGFPGKSIELYPIDNFIQQLNRNPAPLPPVTVTPAPRR